MKKLYRSRTERMIAGVCGGLGQYFGIDPTLMRLAFVAFTLAGGAGVLLYAVLAIIMPLEPATEVQGQQQAPSEREADWRPSAEEGLHREAQEISIPPATYRR